MTLQRRLQFKYKSYFLIKVPRKLWQQTKLELAEEQKKEVKDAIKTKI